MKEKSFLDRLTFRSRPLSPFALLAGHLSLATPFFLSKSMLASPLPLYRSPLALALASSLLVSLWLLTPLIMHAIFLPHLRRPPPDMGVHAMRQPCASRA